MSPKREQIESYIRQLETVAPKGDIVRVVRPQNIVHFATHSEWLGLDLDPRQALVLKLIDADRSLLTAFDYEVLNEWRRGFTPHYATTSSTAEYRGEFGVVPDVLERMALLEAEERRFKRVVLVLGRRASKSFLNAV